MNELARRCLITARRLLLSTLAAGAIVSNPVSASAQGNPQSQVLGGQSALMGGTGVVLGEDSASPFLNPAAVARINQSTLALSSQLVEFEYRTLSNFRQPTAPEPPFDQGVELENADVTDFGVDFIPTAICYFQNIGEVRPTDRSKSHTLSLCIGATESNNISSFGDSASETAEGFGVDTTSSLQSEWNRLAINLGWGHFFTSWLATGASLVVEQSNQNVALSTTALLEDLDSSTSRSNAFVLSRTGTSYSLRAEAGAIARLTDRVHVGISGRTPAWVFASSYSATQLRDSLDGGSRRRVDEGSFRAPAPLRFAVGVGYETERLQLELDLFFFLPQSDFLELDVEREVVTVEADGSTTREQSSEQVQDSSNFAVNVAAGGRYVVSPRWSLLAGFQTDFSLLEDRSKVAASDLVAVRSSDLLFGSLGFGYRGRIGNFVSGLRFGYSTGEILAADNFANEPETAVVDDEVLSVLLVIYGSIDFGAVAEDLTPKFLRADDD